MFQRVDPNTLGILSAKQKYMEEEDGIKQDISTSEHITFEDFHFNKLSIKGGICSGTVWEVMVDGAWKRNKKYKQTSGIGWLDGRKIFEGCNIVFATSTLQAEAHDVLTFKRYYKSKWFGVQLFQDRYEFDKTFSISYESWGPTPFVISSIV